MAKAKSAYAQKLLDPRWQRLRLEILQRDNFACTYCGDTKGTLFVHHGFYTAGKQPWEYPVDSLHTTCSECHSMADQVREELKSLNGSLSVKAQDAMTGMLSCLVGFPDELIVALLQELSCPLAWTPIVDKVRSRFAEDKSE